MKTYMFKLYHSKRNQHLQEAISLAGEIWNQCVETQREYYKETKKYLPCDELQKKLTEFKNTTHPHWFALGSQAIQDIAHRLDRGYKRFFHDRKSGKKRTRPPRFKPREKYKSFTLKQAGYKFLGGNRIKILGRVYKYFKSREIEGKVKTVTVKRDALGDLYLYIVTDTIEFVDKRPIHTAIGYDFGIKIYLTGSDGSYIKSPMFFKKGLDKIQRLNRSLSSKKKGSSHRQRAKTALARQHKKIKNQRTDFHFKLARELCADFDLIALEDLDMKWMQRRFGKKVSDYGFADFVRILEHISNKLGATVGHAPKYYPSSQLCHVCGFRNRELKLSQREWDCPKCHTLMDRDLNAAINISKVVCSELGHQLFGLEVSDCSNTASSYESRIPRL